MQIKPVSVISSSCCSEIFQFNPVIITVSDQSGEKQILLQNCKQKRNTGFSYLESVMTTIALLVQGATNRGDETRSYTVAFSIAWAV